MTDETDDDNGWGELGDEPVRPGLPEGAFIAFDRELWDLDVVMSEGLRTASDDDLSDDQQMYRYPITDIESLPPGITLWSPTPITDFRDMINALAYIMRVIDLIREHSTGSEPE